MTGLHYWFWLLLTIACVVWYATITVYVGIRGALDIKHMLRDLAASREEKEEASCRLGGNLSRSDRRSVGFPTDGSRCEYVGTP